MSQQIRFEGEGKDIAGLVTKLVDILGECKAVKKSGNNKSQGYQYATESDILDVVRDALVNKKIFVFSSSNTKEVIKMDKMYKGEKQGENILAVVNSEHAFVDGSTGARVVVCGTGTGWDMTDKGVFKAITGLNKYMFSKNFMIESEDDPERDNANPGYVRNNAAKSKVESSKPTAPTKSTTRPFSRLTKSAETPKEEPVTEAKIETKVEEKKETPKRKSFGKREFVKKEANF